jgi:hypothetical protein
MKSDLEPVSYRLYTFVAGLYLSPLQCGLQSIHVCSELYAYHVCSSGTPSQKMKVFDRWASTDKTVVICSARTSLGVKDTFEILKAAGERYDLPSVLFHEDEESLGRAATATGIIVPDYFYDAKFDEGRPPLGEAFVFERNGTFHFYEPGSPEFEFVKFLKSFRLV